MNLNSFIVSFFASKNLSLLTAFLCWNPGELSELWRSARSAGLRLRTVRDFRAPPPPPPALPASALPREGVVLDMSCPDAAFVLDEASSSRAFNLRYTWLLLDPFPFNTSTLAMSLSHSLILPDADVTWAAEDMLVDVYRVKAEQPLIVTELGLDGSSSAQGLQALWRQLPTAVARRKDLNNVRLKSVVIVSQPQHFKSWSDLNDRQIDTFPKLTYPLMNLAAEDLHFRYNSKQVDLYGEERNGSFDGLVGRLQRGEAELGIASVFMRADRLRVMHYCAETVELRGAFIFRQPAQSSVRNVFLLPFSGGVWAACGGVAAAAALALAGLRPLRPDPELAVLTPLEALTFVVGAACQQGTHVSPSLVSARLVMFSALTASLFAFTAYSAKIVSILQAPSDAVRSVADIARSPMACGVQDTTYKRVYFAESTDPATQRLYRRKLLPLGEAAYLSVVDGIARVRNGLFAFQVEESAGYEVISRTFTEREKCGLKQIPAFKLPMVAVPLRKNSGYRDLLASRVRWQREAGLTSRWRRVWLAPAPRCDAAGAGVSSVRLADVLPSVQILVIGPLLSLVLLGSELAVHRLRRRRRPVQMATLNITIDDSKDIARQQQALSTETLLNYNMNNVTVTV